MEIKTQIAALSFSLKEDFIQIDLADGTILVPSL